MDGFLRREPALSRGPNQGGRLPAEGTEVSPVLTPAIASLPRLVTHLKKSKSKTSCHRSRGQRIPGRLDFSDLRLTPRRRSQPQHYEKQGQDASGGESGAPSREPLVTTATWSLQVWVQSSSAGGGHVNGPQGLGRMAPDGGAGSWARVCPGLTTERCQGPQAPRKPNTHMYRHIYRLCTQHLGAQTALWHLRASPGDHKLHLPAPCKGSPQL